MADPVLMQHTRSRRRRWIALSGLGLLAYLAVATLYVWRGQLNADEGWYLTAGRLVYAGQMAYRDFMFTQAPLLPYVYGLPQRLFGSSLVVGRLTSVALTAVGLVAGMRVAHRLGGWPAAALTAWLLAAFSFGVYYQTLVKTYALVACCFALTLLCLTGDAPEELRLPLATLAALAAGLTRISALAFAALIVPYVLWAATRWRTRWFVLATLAVVGAVCFWTWREALPQARWNVLTYHMQRWPTGTPAEVALEMVSDRLPSLAEPYGAYWLLGVTLTLATLAARARLALGQPRAPLTVYGLAVMAFATANFVGGGWHREYLAPSIVAALPLMAILAVRLAWRMGIPGRQFVASLLAGALILAPVSHGLNRTDLLEQPPGLPLIAEYAALVRQHSAPDEPFLALEALWVAVEADRPLLPGLNMAQYAYLKGSRDEALARHAVNGEIVAEYVEQRLAPVVVLTDLDWSLIKASGHAERIRAALEAGYDVVRQDEQFGQRIKPATLYVRRGP